MNIPEEQPECTQSETDKTIASFGLRIVAESLLADQVMLLAARGKKSVAEASFVAFEAVAGVQEPVVATACPSFLYSVVASW